MKFIVHPLQRAPRGGQPNRVEPRRTAQKKTTSQFTSSYFGLVHGSGKWHKEHALSNHAKSESSRVGRDWPVMSATQMRPLAACRSGRKSAPERRSRRARPTMRAVFESRNENPIRDSNSNARSPSLLPVDGHILLVDRRWSKKIHHPAWDNQ